MVHKAVIKIGNLNLIAVQERKNSYSVNFINAKDNTKIYGGSIPRAFYNFLVANDIIEVSLCNNQQKS